MKNTESSSIVYTILKNVSLILVINLGYFVYLETNKSTRGLFIRPNDKGKKVISWISIWNFMTIPFTNSILWKPENWDINYPIVIGSIFIISKYFV